MLVLTRKVEEKIQIGPDVTVTVLRVKGRSVQIGIEAPSRVLVLRGELVAASDRRTNADEALGGPSDAASSIAAPGTPEPAHEEADPEEHRPAPRRFCPPQESFTSGADDLINPIWFHR
jgi:carbon storage regulator